MKKSVKILTLAFSICLFSSFKAPEVTQISTTQISAYDSCDDLIKTWVGDLFGITAHFNSRACAENAGADNIQPGGLWPQCQTFICI
ncbi:hypothetical protein [Olleya sp. HaHaR_3_96]|uniref:hypothetical protein n=1 Tax=Olleya sp. HaHaR_3_96 TaxID=2745560 RepID=UPI001C4F5508|nr:hypothetical protein [Olleya sp. HaHaR_3_96]QXP58453.1 hypothetical protein H0I26_11030 [Olleya sp. HaHaR_3_96]